MVEPKAKALKFACISDTHNDCDITIPDCDVLIHAGDFTNLGWPQEVKKFNDFLGNLKIPIKIVIAGNHDITFDEMRQKTDLRDWFHKLKAKYEPKEVKALLTNCIYLEDSSCEINGQKFYGSPQVPSFGGWGFMLHKGMPLKMKWDKIPQDTNILITHGPPFGILDKTETGKSEGCPDLLARINEIKPLQHVFGHVHEGQGFQKDEKLNINYINAALCDNRLQLINKPIIFELPRLK